MSYDPRAVALTKQDKLAVSKLTDQKALRSHYRAMAHAQQANLRNRTRGNKSEKSAT
jgi:hypothetical protein